ncbi:DUF3325 domain-containing protein [Sphingobium sp. H39-3-25]|uniref:DUF3325 domain-containing protein n=1 Tax=Sphingobium arseniciresistens TaxID=3030834 RepID=UPI0023B9F3E8|nr:DUF3325 domain-containing protein [Sphingobium arseniciresistens]
MPLESGLIAYAAFANLAVAIKKHRPKKPVPAMLAPPRARLVGAVLLAISLIVAVLRFGGAQGFVAWVGELCIAGAMLVLLMSWRPRLALSLGLATLACAVPFVLL